MARLSQVQHVNKALEEAVGFSAIVQANGLLHLAGILALDESGQLFEPDDMAAQIDRIYDIMTATLAKCGATLEHVVSEVIYTTDLGRLNEAASVRAERYSDCAFPATTAIQITALAFPGALLEIQATAQLEGKEWSADIPPIGSPV